MIVVPVATISDAEWGFFTAIVAAVGAGFGGAIKIILSQRDDINELTAKIIDKAIPALEANAHAGEQIVDATRQVLTALAVAQALREQDPGPRRRGP